MVKSYTIIIASIYLLRTSLAVAFESNFKANNIVSPSFASLMNSIELRPTS